MGRVKVIEKEWPMEEILLTWSRTHLRVPFRDISEATKLQNALL